MGVYLSDDNVRRMEELMKRVSTEGVPVRFDVVVDVINQVRNLWAIAKEETRLNPPTPILGTYKCDATKLGSEAFVSKIDFPLNVEEAIQRAYGITPEQAKAGVRAKAIYFNVADEDATFDTAEKAVQRGKVVGMANILHNETNMDWDDSLEAATALAKEYVFDRKNTST